MRRIKALALVLTILTVTFSSCVRADADIFYASSNYNTGSAGVVTWDGSFRIHKNLVANYGGDAAGFTFEDHNGAARAMIREYHYAANDTVYVYAPPDWENPIVNTTDWGTNFHSAASSGQYLYLTTYESFALGSDAEDTGEVVRVDMKDGYARDRAYHYERHAENGHTVSPHAEAIHIEGGKIYVLYGMPYNGVTQYEASEIVEFDPELNVLRKVRIGDSSGDSDNSGDSAKAAKNAVTMAYRGGKLYVAAMGGYQGPDSWGGVWQADLSSMTVKQVLDGHDMPYTIDGQSVNVGLYGVDFADDGTAFILAGSYSADYTFRARLYVTTESGLAEGDAGAVVKEYSGAAGKGYSWGILWDEADSILWCMTGKSLEARSKTGSPLREFTPAELGDNVYSVALLNGIAIDEGGDEETSGGSGGGCDTGAFSLVCAAVLIWLASLMYVSFAGLKKREKR